MSGSELYVTLETSKGEHVWKGEIPAQWLVTPRPGRDLGRQLPEVVMWGGRVFLILSPSAGLYREVRGYRVPQPVGDPQMMPQTTMEVLHFLIGWKWATTSALENGWLERDEAIQLEVHGDLLAEEAKRRLEGEARG